jgi:hypothetical protein
MRGAPDFKAWPDPVNGMWKIELLRWISQVANIDTLIETGTCEGITPWNLRNDFRKILTIELHEGLFESASKRLNELKNIKQYFGSSKNLLEQMIKDAQTQRILFWLDAHSSGPHTADDGDPLPFEIKTITSLCPGALVVIDDMRGLEPFVKQVGASLPAYGWHVEYRTGEIVLHKEGSYNIPQFD